MFDTNPSAYIPHRESMLLLDEVLSLSDSAASARVTIGPQSSFFMAKHGVPSWVGIEYMGQTAALIGGLALRENRVKPHVGMLLGTRKYWAKNAFFAENQMLTIKVEQAASVGEELANFSCEISDAQSETCLATSRLSVFRRFTS